MNYTKKLIELVKKKQGLTSDYGVAKLIQVTPQMVHDWQKEKAGANTVNALKLIVAAGVSAEDALSIVTEHPANAGGALSRVAKQCILC